MLKTGPRVTHDQVPPPPLVPEVGCPPVAGSRDLRAADVGPRGSPTGAAAAGGHQRPADHRRRLRPHPRPPRARSVPALPLYALAGRLAARADDLLGPNLSQRL